MGPKGRDRKRARKEDGIPGNPIEEDTCNSIQRKGVTWRKNPTKCVSEMRPPDWKAKLNFGSYKTEPEAMVARDYGAFLRASAGEKYADAGGFGSDQLYQFEESREIFESMEETKVRRESIRPLYQQLIKEKWSGVGDPPHRKFCKEARKDIEIAIGVFRERYPHRLLTSPPTETEKDVAKVEPVDGGVYCTSSSSNPEVRVSPELSPGRESGAIAGGAASPWADLLVMAPVQIAVAMNGSFPRILSDMRVPLLDGEQIFQIIRAWIHKVEEELNNAWLEKFLEESGPCSVDPLSIPAIDVPESKI